MDGFLDAGSGLDGGAETTPTEPFPPALTYAPGLKMMRELPD